MAFVRLAVSPRFIALTVAVALTLLFAGAVVVHPDRPWVIGTPLAVFKRAGH